MKEDVNSFNLIDEPWIRVRMSSGETEELSMLGVFQKARLIRTLTNDLSTQDFALLRLLLAILERSLTPLFDDYDYPFELWGDLWERKDVPVDAVEIYLRKWYDRFDLLDKQQPFMQVPNMQSVNGTASEIKKIIADCPDGLPLFSLRSGDGLNTVTLSEAARWLVHAQAFDTSGIKTGMVGDVNVKDGKVFSRGTTGWAGGIGGVYLEGENLAETLLLNLCLCADCKMANDEFLDDGVDLPVWERGQSSLGDSGRAPAGYADVYTWQSRRILMQQNEGRVGSVLLTYGDRTAYQNMRAIEPMTAWRRSPAQEKKLKSSPVYMPYTHAVDRSFWRGLMAVLPERERSRDDSYVAPGVVLWAGHLASTNGGRKLDSTKPIRLHASGFVYGAQNVKYAEMIDDALSMSALLMSPEGYEACALVKQNIETTDEAVQALGYLAANLLLASGCDAPVVANSRSIVQSEAYFEVDGHFRSWLASICDGSPVALQQYERKWHSTLFSLLMRMGGKLVADADAKALQGRKVIRKVKRRNRELWMSAGIAEAQFRASLHKLLEVEKPSKSE